jgi:hypothetical protein
MPLTLTRFEWDAKKLLSKTLSPMTDTYYRSGRAILPTDHPVETDGTLTKRSRENGKKDIDLGNDHSLGNGWRGFDRLRSLHNYCHVAWQPRPEWHLRLSVENHPERHAIDRQQVDCRIRDQGFLHSKQVLEHEDHAESEWDAHHSASHLQGQSGEQQEWNRQGTL